MRVIFFVGTALLLASCGRCPETPPIDPKKQILHKFETGTIQVDLLPEATFPIEDLRSDIELLGELLDKL